MTDLKPQAERGSPGAAPPLPAAQPAAGRAGRVVDLAADRRRHVRANGARRPERGLRLPRRRHGAGRGRQPAGRLLDGAGAGLVRQPRAPPRRAAQRRDREHRGDRAARHVRDQRSRPPRRHQCARRHAPSAARGRPVVQCAVECGERRLLHRHGRAASPRAGRSPTSRRTAPAGRRVAIIDDTLARRLWPGGRALGQQVEIVEREARPNEAPVAYDVVGIVGSTHRAAVRGRTARRDLRAVCAGRHGQRALPRPAANRAGRPRR